MKGVLVWLVAGLVLGLGIMLPVVAPMVVGEGGGVEVERVGAPVWETEPAAVVAVLERSCLGCHGGEAGAWSPEPVARLVREGRKSVDYSVWGGYSEAERADLRRESLREVLKGTMPVHEYVELRGDVVPTEAEVEVLRSWAEGG